MKKLTLISFILIFFLIMINCSPTGTGEFYNLTIEIVDTTGNPQATWGTVTPANGEKEEGTFVKLQVTPGTNYGFLKWTDSSGTQLSTSNPYNFIMPGQDTTVRVVLGAKYVLTIEVVDNTGTPQPTWGTATPTSGSSYIETKIVQLKAISNKGYHFVRWEDSTGTQLSTISTYNFTMPGQNTTVKVVFEEAGPPPGFTLTNFNSNAVTFPDDFTGDYIFLTFSACWCGPCNTQAGYMVGETGVFTQLTNSGITNFENIIIITDGYTGAPATLADAQTYANNHSGLKYVMPDSNDTSWNAYANFITRNGFDPTGEEWGFIPANIMLRPVGNSFEVVDFFSGSLSNANAYITYLQNTVPDMFN